MNNLRLFVYCRITHPTRLEPIKVPAKLWDNCKGNWFEQRKLVAQIAFDMVHVGTDTYSSVIIIKDVNRRKKFTEAIAFEVM